MSIFDDFLGKTTIEKKKNLVRIIYVTIALLLIVATVLAVSVALSSDVEEDNEDKQTTVVKSKTITCDFSETKKGTLLVVNKKSDPYDFTVNSEAELVSISSSVPMADGSALYSLQKDGMLSERKALEALNQMITDFYAQASDKTAAKMLSINSAYRTHAEQSGYSVPAGHSDFHTGMLFELTVGKNSISENDTFDWIYENAHKYGFIERYPESKSDITGVVDFDNAFRYVGAPHASYIKENGLSLEEYVDKIKNASTPMTISGYKVSYVKANINATTEIIVSTEYYSVSGDNNGGFIVTTK